MRELKKWIRVNRVNKGIKKKTWRMYKNFFLRVKKINYLIRYKHLFNNSLISKKYYSQNNSLKTTKYIFRFMSKCKKNSANKTYNFFHFLFFRLHLALVQCHLVFDKYEGTSLIKNGFIYVNNRSIRNLNYTLKTQDLIFLYVKPKTMNKFVKKLFLSKLRFKRRKSRNKFRYKFLRRSILHNFLEVNYYTRSVVYIRPLRSSETNKKKRKWNFKRRKKGPLKKYNNFKFGLVKKLWAFS
jgi:hypothetical protein